MDDRGSIPCKGNDGIFSLRHRVKTSPGVYPASYPIRTGASFRGRKRPWREADHSLPCNSEVKKCVELYLHFSNASSWRGAYLGIGTTT
jgi:hypothetical protein